MKTAINTRTQEEYDALMRYFGSQNIPWRNGKSATLLKLWTCPESCVDINEECGNRITYGLADHYLAKGYAIIPFTEFTKANITAEIDYKAKYEEAVMLLRGVTMFAEEDGSVINGFMLRENVIKIKQFLTKHKDGE